MNLKRIWWSSLAAAVPVVAQAQVTAPEAAELQVQAGAPAQPPTAVVPTPVDLSGPVVDLVKLAESGVGDEVVLAYIRNSQAVFNLSADHVVYLKDLGLSPEVISAMLSHDTEIRAQGPTQYNAPTNQAPAPAPVPEVPVTTAAVEQPAPVYVEQPPPTEVNYFYNDLAPYGSWVVLDGYGWCWQPRSVVINRSWRPYCDGGRWVYSDCGWYWQSDYSWGWAPFHYGRWTMHNRCGWVWMPDRVWGPAWVTWRVGGNYCGWAPLPPRTYWNGHGGWNHHGIQVGVNVDFGLHSDHFTFVGMNAVTDHNLRHRRLGPTEVRNVYNQTTVINNYGNNNNTVVNYGVPVDRVAAATHQPIQRATVRDVPADVASRSRWQRPTRDQAEPVVYRTQLRTPATPVRATAQKVDDRNPVIQHPTLTPSRWQQPSRTTRTASAGAAVPGASTATARPAQSTWQAPQRSVGSSVQAPGSQPENRNTTRSMTRATPATTPSSGSSTRSAQTGAAATPATPASPASRSTWQTPSRNDRTVVPPAAAGQQSYRSAPSASVPPTATREEKPASSALPQQSRWDTPSRRAPAPNVVQTAPPQSNPHVYFPKSSGSAAPQANSGRWSTPSTSRSVPQSNPRPSVPAPAATTRPAPQTSNSQSGSRGTQRSDNASGWSSPSSSRNRNN